MRVPLDLLVKAGMWDLVRDAEPLTATAKIEQAKALERHGQQVQASASAEDRAMAEFMAEHFPTGEQVAAGASVLVGRRHRPTDAQLAAAIGAVGEVDHSALDAPADVTADFLTRPRTRPSSDGFHCA